MEITRLISTAARLSLGGGLGTRLTKESESDNTKQNKAS